MQAGAPQLLSIRGRLYVRGTPAWSFTSNMSAALGLGVSAGVASFLKVGSANVTIVEVAAVPDLPLSGSSRAAPEASAGGAEGGVASAGAGGGAGGDAGASGAGGSVAGSGSDEAAAAAAALLRGGHRRRLLAGTSGVNVQFAVASSSVQAAQIVGLLEFARTNDTGATALLSSLKEAGLYQLIAAQMLNPPVTQSFAPPPPRPEPPPAPTSDSKGGLSWKTIVIIAVVVGGTIALVSLTYIVCVCCVHKQPRTPPVSGPPAAPPTASVFYPSYPISQQPQQPAYPTAGATFGPPVPQHAAHAAGGQPHPHGGAWYPVTSYGPPVAQVYGGPVPPGAAVPMAMPYSAAAPPPGY